MVTRTNTKNSTIVDNKNIPYLIIRPKSHEDWLVERNKGIGASEAAKAIGCSKYGSAYQLWRDKVGLNQPIEENWAMKMGHIFEKEVAELFEEHIGYKIIKNTTGDWLAVDRDMEFLRVSPDRLYWLKDDDGNDMAHNLLNRGILECKTSMKHYTPECIYNECISWFVQVQYQLHVMHIKEGYIGFLCTDSLSGGDFWFEKIPYNEKFCRETLIPALTELWREHIAPAREYFADGINDNTIRLANVYAPTITDGSDVTDRYPTQDKENVINAADIVETDEDGHSIFEQLSLYSQYRSQKKSIEEAMKKIENSIRVEMKDADSIIDVDGKAVVTFRQNKSSMKFDSKRFKVENPDLYEQYCNEEPGARVLKIK